MASKKQGLMDLRRDGEMTMDSYTVPGYCDNCGWRGMLQIAKGNRAPAAGGIARTPSYCKNCGVSELRAAPRAPR